MANKEIERERERFHWTREQSQRIEGEEEEEGNARSSFGLCGIWPITMIFNNNDNDNIADHTLIQSLSPRSDTTYIPIFPPFPSPSRKTNEKEGGGYCNDQLPQISH